MRSDAAFARGIHGAYPDPGTDMVDFLFGTTEDPHTPDAVFDQLRWGGEFVFITWDKAAGAELERRFDRRGGFVVERPLAAVRSRFMGMRLPVLSRKAYYFRARKTLLVRPGQSSDRFTYHVELVRHPQLGDEYVVVKQVPAVDRVISRLREKLPDTPLETLKRRARKFTEKIFPVFLTREAAMLQILQHRLPEQFRNRVPRVVAVEKDANGFVRTLYMNWMRNAKPDVVGTAGGVEASRKGRALTQLEFARQSAELLHALHDVVGVIHLDLRLDNFVITRHGVGFVDFGSAVRLDERFPEASLLSSLFEEMMRTSQIQRMLGKMQDAGEVTSHEIRKSYGKVDKAVDFFYLAVQINNPHANPDFVGLVDFERGSPEALRLEALTEEILRPQAADKPTFKSAGDILAGIRKLEEEMYLGAGVPEA